jgi:hypothetical protein
MNLFEAPAYFTKESRKAVGVAPVAGSSMRAQCFLAAVLASPVEVGKIF